MNIGYENWWDGFAWYFLNLFGKLWHIYLYSSTTTITIETLKKYNDITTCKAKIKHKDKWEIKKEIYNSKKNHLNKTYIHFLGIKYDIYFELFYHIKKFVSNSYIIVVFIFFFSLHITIKLYLTNQSKHTPTRLVDSRKWFDRLIRIHP